MRAYTYDVTLADSSQGAPDTDPAVTDAPATRVVRCDITHQDRLRAEQMGAQMGLPSIADAPLTGTTLWCWAALRRTGDLGSDVKASTFLNSLCLDIANAGAPDGDEVPPTPATPPSESPSS